MENTDVDQISQESFQSAIFKFVKKDSVMDVPLRFSQNIRSRISIEQSRQLALIVSCHTLSLANHQLNWSIIHKVSAGLLMYT